MSGLLIFSTLSPRIINHPMVTIKIPRLAQALVRSEKGEEEIGIEVCADKSGPYPIKPQFHEAGDFSIGMAMVRIGVKTGHIDNAGK